MTSDQERAPLFAKGQKVQFLSDRSQIGDVLAEPKLRGGSYWYRLRLMDGSRVAAHEADLAPYKVGISPQDLLLEGAFGDRDDFLRLVTFHKLDVPLDNTLYSLQGSRTDFYAHQYKPLLKFLDSADQRLLIADEVGLGKTIEAGLIMIEQRARRALDRMMVVCPAALCLKWKDEMWRRFDEDFEIISASKFRQRLNEFTEHGALRELREIISLQSVRSEDHIEMLELAPLPLDLLVIDEAHHLRNPGTLSHQVCAQLAENASAVLLLTATPIQLGRENLFNLFRILNPAEFEDFEVFQERLQANEPVVEAQRLARQSPPPRGEIADRIQSLGNGGRASFFIDNPIYHRVRGLVEAQEDFDHASAAHLQQDLEELSLLSHVFSRSKKRDVFPDSSERTASVVRVELTPVEREFYDAVTEFVRDSAPSQTGTIRYFSTMGAQRQAASCMPAARNKFGAQAQEHYVNLKGIEAHDLEEIEQEIATKISKRVIEAGNALGLTDTKYDQLLELLSDLDRREPNRKLILFAYYKGTLNYLYDRLRRDGFRCELIHGDITSDPVHPENDERSKRMRRFRDDPEVRILLSSEVGSEGLDFQFCHIIINYDLPWNPMRVEQRIGRVDRLGQESDRVLIFNFTLVDTIEERVLSRLYDRIRIFEESIGDLDAIIGDEMRRLTFDLLSSHLTAEEEEARIEQTSRVLVRAKADLDRLESESAKFVGHDAYFEEQLARIRAGGELLSSGDREAFFRRYLEEAFEEARLNPTRREGVYRLSVPDSFDMAVRQLPDGAPKLRFLRQIKDREVEVTFDSNTAYRWDDVEFLGAHHPVFQLATQHYRDHSEIMHPVSALSLQSSDNAPPGRYLYLLFSVSIEAGRMRRKLEPLFLRLDDGDYVPLSSGDGSLLLGDVLRNAQPLEDDGALSRSDFEDAVERAWDEFEERLDTDRRNIEERNAAIVQTRLVSLEKTHEGRMKRVADRLNQAERMNHAERILRMYRGQIRNIRANYEARRGELEGDIEIHMDPRLIGCGILRIGTGA